MACILQQVSSLEKIRIQDGPNFPEITEKAVFRGERFSYQVVLFITDFMQEYRVSVDGPCKEWVQLYAVKQAVMDMPIYTNARMDDYMTMEPGLMPDILLPLEEQNGVIQVLKDRCTAVWVRVDVPADASAGVYPVTLRMTRITEEEMKSRGVDPALTTVLERTMTLEVLPIELPKQSLKYTQWFYADCIALAHQVEIYSEAHWALIDQYMAAAAECGINMLLLPVITPPLDTMYGIRRPCVQLVDIEKAGESYRFGFERLHRWIGLCKKNGIQYYEVCHLFSQWGLKCTPNILVRENGADSFYFGWHMAAGAPEYENFLRQFLPTLVEELKKAGVESQTYFHVSDEPGEAHLADYRRFAGLVRSLIGDCKRIDALSHLEFYDMGLVDIPCVNNNGIKPFLERKLPEQWVYYCMSQRDKVSNRFLAMPAYRNRIMGLQMYRTDVKGFLHWGFNYYYSRCSTYEINPWQTTSSDLTFPSGDPFSVYPGKNGPIQTMRALVFYEGIQDMQTCQLLESLIGREAVCRLIDEAAGAELEYDVYPRNAKYILDLREQMTALIRKHLEK